MRGDRDVFAPDLSRATWRKSSRSNGAGGECVEVAEADAFIAVRDSKVPSGPSLAFPAQQWSALLRDIKTGRHDLT
ncbi:DUF397 domain-containing protein [Actinomadura rubrisoli]|uniref:DUF397 domain-containing protein n=2 Tax=Actinomadura rubrisoli TaxID=2530368 RepID=A0A4R5C1T3_9ACTN|nr:DUF397 domain-containing protein [Actinomadura rubrisoli]TDD92246.1 DUF397 domain-containing protein [Actinomadura rubrisoli]